MQITNSTAIKNNANVTFVIEESNIRGKFLYRAEIPCSSDVDWNVNYDYGKSSSRENGDEKKLHSRFDYTGEISNSWSLKIHIFLAYEHKFNEFPWRFSSRRKVTKRKWRLYDLCWNARMAVHEWILVSYLWCSRSSLHLIIDKFAKLKVLVNKMMNFHLWSFCDYSEIIIHSWEPERVGLWRVEMIVLSAFVSTWRLKYTKRWNRSESWNDVKV